MNLAKSERFWASLLEVQYKHRQLLRTSNGSNYTIRGVPVSRRKEGRKAWRLRIMSSGLLCCKLFGAGRCITTHLRKQ